MLGRLEYQKGNLEAALHVFEGIDIASVTPKMKVCIARRGDMTKGERRKRRSSSEIALPMSMHAVSLLFEAIFLKAKSLQVLRRYRGMIFLDLKSLVVINICLFFEIYILCGFVC